MIQAYTSALVPGWIVGSDFPDADETLLSGLSETWTEAATRTAGTTQNARTHGTKLLSAWQGAGADAAAHQFDAVTAFGTSTGEACTQLAAACLTASRYVTNAKTAINNVLRATDTTVRKLLAQALVDPLRLTTIADDAHTVFVWARALIEGYGKALVTAMGSIRLTFSIEPKLRRVGATDGSTGSTGSNVAGGTGQGGAGGADNPGGWSEVLDASTSGSVSDGSAIGSSNDKVVADHAQAVADATGPEDPTATVAATTSDETRTRLADQALADITSGTGLSSTEAGSTAAASALDLAGSQVDLTKLGDGSSAGPGTSTDGSGTSGSAAGSSAGRSPFDAIMSDSFLVDRTPAGGGSGAGGSGGTGGSGGSGGSGSWTGGSGGSSSGGSGASTSGGSGSGTSGGSWTSGTQSGWTPPVHQSPAASPAGPSGAGSLPSGTGAAGGGASGTGGITVDTGAGGGSGSGGSGGSGHQGGSGGSLAGGGSTGGSSGGWSGGAPDGQATGTGAAGTGTATGPGMVSGGTGVPGAVGPSSGLPGLAGGAPLGSGLGLGGGSMGSPLGGGIGGGLGGTPPGVSGSLAAPLAGQPVTGMPAASGGAPAVPTASAPGGGVPAAPTASTPGTGAAPSTPAPPTNVAAPGATRDGPGPLPPRTDVAGAPGQADPSGLAAALAALGLVGAAAAGFALLWRDLNASQTWTPPAQSATTASLLPTQFGPGESLVMTLPAELATPYQKVLPPGESDALLAGLVTTVRGLVYPLDQTRHLLTPSDLSAALGLGFALRSADGSDTLAFSPDMDSVDVLRFAGVRTDDLITPVAADVDMPPHLLPVPMVRHHARPWNGSGEAPGSTSTHPIDEHEILGYSRVPVPHLAEIWRVFADGHSEHVATYSARSGQWLGHAVAPQPGQRTPNGAYAVLGDPDGQQVAFETVLLTADESVLLSREATPPQGFEAAADGTFRFAVDNALIRALIGVATVATWAGAPVQVLHSDQGLLLVDYAGDDSVQAHDIGFVQVNQGQWSPRWVPAGEVSATQEFERAYPLPARQPVSA